MDFPIRHCFLANEFVISTGCILLKPIVKDNPSLPRLPEDYTLVYIHNLRTGLNILAKGRKDISEDIKAAALRETYEETGYKCHIIPLPTPTLQPVSDSSNGNRPLLNEEAIAINMTTDTHSRKALGLESQKFVYWFVGEVDTDENGQTVERVVGTQLPHEQYDVLEMDLDAACRANETGLAHEADRKLIQFTKELLVQRHKLAQKHTAT